MFNSSRSSSTSMDLTTAKRILEEKCQTIEQLKKIIDELKLRYEKKENDLIKHIGVLYNDLQQNKKKMAHLLLKYQQQKKFNQGTKMTKELSTQTDENSSLTICSKCSSHNQEIKSHTVQKKSSDHNPKYYTLQTDNNLDYISATPQHSSDHSLSSSSPSTTDQSSIKHNESSSSAYNTADSLPSSTYSDDIESLERVLSAACTMYTTHNNLEHTIKLQEELFRQRLRLRGIELDKTDDTSSEHFYDNIDGETSDIEKQKTSSLSSSQNRSSPWYEKKQHRTVTFCLNNEQDKHKTTSNRVKSNDQLYSNGKRKNFKLLSKPCLTKLTNNRKSMCQNSNRKLLSNMLTVTIT